MSELTHQPEFDDSLLSAYVDGELTADERAMVEARLAEDPQARQLVADLEAVSANVRSLPRAKLTEDVRAGVFQQIDGPAVPLQPSNLTMRKRLLWPVLATAALVMLMFYQPAGKEKEMEVAQIDRVQVSKKRAKAKNESAPASVPVIEAMEEIPQADASGSPRLGDEGLAAAPNDERLDLKREMAADSAVALSFGRAAGGMLPPESNVELVHVTLKQLPSGAEQFDRLLVSNGIELVREAEDSSAAAENSIATFKDSRLFSEPVGGRAGDTAELSDAKTHSAEMVLVEGPPEQIEKFLYACKQDTEAIESLTIEEPANLASPNYIITPEQQGVISALNSLDLAPAGPASAGPQQTQAWATKLRPGQSPIELKQLENQLQSHRTQYSSDQQRKLAKKNADSPQQMRVLFLLHPSEPQSK